MRHAAKLTEPLHDCAGLPVFVNVSPDPLPPNLDASLAVSAVEYSLGYQVENMYTTAYTLLQRVGINLFGNLMKCYIIVRGIICYEVANIVTNLKDIELFLIL